MTQLIAVIDGKNVPLTDATWIAFFACGCPFGALTAAIGDEAFATEEQAFREMYPLKRDRDRAIRQGRRMELMSWDRYRAEIDLSARCKHTLAQRTGKAPVDAEFPPNGGHDNDCAYVGGIGPDCTCSTEKASA